ncbi:MAG TPA: hypothetical protein VL693_02120 [Vicinamibacterales bacterium]|jgi:hypothetical protein|nr:hypothetical protein [Vicinamibacterales bacterium]
MTARIATIAGVVLALATVEAATLSKQQADLFSRKVQQIVVQGDRVQQPGTKRTPVSENELNSWFAYSAKPLLPSGVAEPRITLVGNGKVAGQAIVDLDAIAKKKQSGGTFDVWSLVGGKVPVNVSGTLRTSNGVGNFQLESADVSGLPLPKTFLQEMVSYYSRTPAHPQGVKIDDPFELPASIRQIDVSAGQAVIVQ